MKRKKVFFSELAYIMGIVVLAFGTALMEKADFGLSMVVVPAYLLHLKISQYIFVFTFGMAEYFLQMIFIFVLSLYMRKFKVTYLFSFMTAMIYGFVLDIMITLVHTMPLIGIGGRIIYYFVGIFLCAMGVSLLFHTYIPLEAYELVVKEVSNKTNINISIVKTIYDWTSCLVGICLSFVFFGLWQFEGIKLGTIICTFCNGFLIGKCNKILHDLFDFRDALLIRKKFESENIS